ncbi:MAG: hypothetical protein ACK559_26020, partial [bacterium]
NKAVSKENYDHIFALNWNCWITRLNLSDEFVPESKLKYREIPHFSKRGGDGFIIPKSGKDFFHNHNIQKEGKFPILIPPPEGLDDAKIISLYKSWDLWSLDNDGSCTIIEGREVDYKKVRDSKIHIRI